MKCQSNNVLAGKVLQNLPQFIAKTCIFSQNFNTYLIYSVVLHKSSKLYYTLQLWTLENEVRRHSFCQSTNPKRHRGHGFYKLQTFTVSQTHLQILGNVNRDSTPYLFKCLLHSSFLSVHFLTFNFIYNVLYSVQEIC